MNLRKRLRILFIVLAFCGAIVFVGNGLTMIAKKTEVEATSPRLYSLPAEKSGIDKDVLITLISSGTTITCTLLTIFLKKKD